MPCDTVTTPGKSIQTRAEEIRRVVAALSNGLARGTIKAIVGPQGAIAFDGFDPIRNGVTDACAYRRIMSTGSALAKHMIDRAAQLAGRGVDRKVIAQGTHSHDGGMSWTGRD